MNPPADISVLKFRGLDISFHRTTRVQDDADPSKQPKTEAKYISSSDPCKLTLHREGNDPVYLLALDCQPHESLPSMSLAISSPPSPPVLPTGKNKELTDFKN